MSMKNYVIIGGGIAALGCIEGIRAVDKEGKITLIGEEEYAPYARPLISYYLEGKTDPKKMQYRTEEFYKENNVNLKLGAKALKIDGKTVICSDGEKLPFDSLLAATGSSPFVPPVKGLDTVGKYYTFMTLSDALEIEKATDKNSRVLIVGAGLIGLKCAEGLWGRVSKITVCDLADRVLSSILDKECAGIIEEKLKAKGIDFMLANTAESFEGKTAKMKNGETLDFDVLIMAVGVRPNLSLLKEAGAEINRGVLVNSKMQTSVPDIYAAGDITEAPDISSGTNKVMAILPNAHMGGICAGKNMAGEPSVFDTQIPMNSIGFFGYHLMTAGTYEGELYEEKGEDFIKKLYVKDNLLKGLIILGKTEKTGIYTSLIRNKTPLDTINYEIIKKNPSLLPFSYKYRRKNLGGVL